MHDVSDHAAIEQAALLFLGNGMVLRLQLPLTWYLTLFGPFCGPALMTRVQQCQDFEVKGPSVRLFPFNFLSL